MVAQATMGSAQMVMLQDRPEGQDGAHGSTQSTAGDLPSVVPGQDPQPIECNICQKRFKKESDLNAVSFQVPSSEVARSADTPTISALIAPTVAPTSDDALSCTKLSMPIQVWFRHRPSRRKQKRSQEHQPPRRYQDCEGP